MITRAQILDRDIGAERYQGDGQQARAARSTNGEMAPVGRGVRKMLLRYDGHAEHRCWRGSVSFDFSPTAFRGHYFTGMLWRAGRRDDPGEAGRTFSRQTQSDAKETTSVGPEWVSRWGLLSAGRRGTVSWLSTRDGQNRCLNCDLQSPGR